MTTKHTPEPWKTFPRCGRDGMSIAPADRDRAIACVNACAGIADPGAAIKLAREALIAADIAAVEPGPTLDAIHRALALLGGK